MSASAASLRAASIEFFHFAQIGFQIGKITSAAPFPKARNPSYQVKVQLGEGVTKQSSAQLPPNYPDMQELFNKTVVCVTNMGSRRIAGFASEILIVGFPDDHGHVHLLNTRGRDVMPGVRLSYDREGVVKAEIPYDKFSAADIRCATVKEIKALATDPNSYRVNLNLGDELGLMQSTICDIDEEIAKELLGSQVPVLINLKPECRYDDETHVLAFTFQEKNIPFGVDKPVKDGVRLF
jgi:tRNA-binding protein